MMGNQLIDNAFRAESLRESRETGNLYIRFDEGEGGKPPLYSTFFALNFLDSPEFLTQRSKRGAKTQRGEHDKKKDKTG